jgi:hypothetical protein
VDAQFWVKTLPSGPCFYLRASGLGWTRQNENRLYRPIVGS